MRRSATARCCRSAQRHRARQLLRGRLSYWPAHARWSCRVGSHRRRVGGQPNLIYLLEAVKGTRLLLTELGLMLSALPLQELRLEVRLARCDFTCTTHSFNEWRSYCGASRARAQKRRLNHLRRHQDVSAVAGRTSVVDLAQLKIESVLLSVQL